MEQFRNTPWWRAAPVLTRLVRDLVAAELAAARPGRTQAPVSAWPEALDLVADLGADSLDLLGVASSLADLLGFARAGNGDALLAQTRLPDWVATAAASLERDASCLTFRTSGSSGAPKRCTHTLGALWRETDFLATLVPGRRRILSAVPAHHIYGFLFTVLLPQAGTALLPVRDLRGTSPAALAALVQPGDLVVGHPDFWAAVAALDLAWPDDVIGVSSGAPCPDACAGALAQAGLALLQVYGSSETGGVGWRTAAGAPYQLFPYWRRCGDALARSTATGSEVLALQDRLLWQDGQCFVPDGRLDAAVQVGGVNVHPGYVAEVLALHPQVAAASVRPMRVDEGLRLKAFVVPAPGADPAALRAALIDWAAARLAVAERPGAFSFGAALPRQPNGKPADWVQDAWD